MHLKKVQKLSNRVVIAYDSDEAGEKASKRAATLALSLGMEVKIASLPKGEDPASIIKEDEEKWKDALKKSEHFTDFILNKAVRENEGRDLTREILKNVLPLANIIKSDIEKSQFIKKIAQKMQVTEETIWNDLKKIKAEIEDFEIIKISDKFKDEKEALMFEVERYGMEIDLIKTKEDISKKIELKNLKQRLQQILITLDEKDISEVEEKKLKVELENIQKSIKTFNN